MENDNLHVHQFKETIIPPTCKEPGYMLYSCDCGYAHKANFKPTTAHSFQITGTTPAMCEMPGSITATCAVCGVTKTQPVPALGHDYGEWVVQQYPYCEVPGRQIHRCRRCGVTETGSIAPLGHSFDPGTAHYDKNKLVEFFCPNCGQFVRNWPKPQTYWPTKIMLLLAALTTVLAYVFMVLVKLNGAVSFITPWLAFSTPIITVIWCIVWFFCVNEIKRNERYTRWMGMWSLMGLTTSILSVAMGVIWDLNNGFASSLLFDILGNLPIITMYLLLTIVFFVGGKKRLWLFVVVLSLQSTVSGISFISTLDCIMIIRELWYSAYRIASSISAVLFWVALAMLIKPAKRQNRHK